MEVVERGGYLRRLRPYDLQSSKAKGLGCYIWISEEQQCNNSYIEPYVAEPQPAAPIQQASCSKPSLAVKKDLVTPNKPQQLLQAVIAANMILSYV